MMKEKAQVEKVATEIADFTNRLAHIPVSSRRLEDIVARGVYESLLEAAQKQWSQLTSKASG